ncbi:endolytic transglycosylase MltG [Candidatus Saccharibacteria bacterium]|nr:endolytic transglycosylase MltG [Candidatus Saccharibacteria bacterium]
MKIVGLDVGEKRIGVSKADSDTRIAVPVGFIEVDGTEWQEIARVARLNNTNLFVLGMPRSNEGNETAQSVYVRNFAKVLTEKIPGARIKFQDESLTSVMAEERLKASGKKYEKGDIDAEAATIILQDFLEGLGNASQVNNAANADLAEDNASDTENSGLGGNIKTAIVGAGSAVGNVAKKEAGRAKLNSAKVKHKVKTSTKMISGFGILLILIAGAVGGYFVVNHIREENARKRAEEYARLEAEMKAATFDFTIRPGETIYDIRDNLMKVDRGVSNETQEKFPNYTTEEINAAFTAKYDYAFLDGRPEGATLEGFLYPETLNFYGESTVQEVLDAFLKEMGRVISENDLVNKYSAQGLSLFEGVTLASVVQKEAPSPEQPTVAQVFMSRLAYGIPMGSDVTVTYALDTVDPNREIYVDNQSALKVNSCYNTRVYAGLPCGPISNPGLSALLAVAAPSDTAYLYFLTGDDGMMYYGYTESEHIQNIYNHCKELCNVSL